MTTPGPKSGGSPDAAPPSRRGPGALVGRLGALLERDVYARAPIPLQLLGRVLLHTAVVGAVVGAFGFVFVRALDLLEHLVLEGLAGYVPLRAGGEAEASHHASLPFRPWLLVIIPAVGALLAGLVSILAPETRGGGTDAVIKSFHEQRGVMRRRVPFLKMLASILTLGFGGSGGREGPIMQIGGSVGSLVGRYFRVTDRERRILLVAGAAAGMSAVFRTPFGAALLAVEVLHRDDFESDALVPSILASVIAYSIFMTGTGGGRMFDHAQSFPFVPGHLWVYGVMALAVSLAGVAFVETMDTVRALARRAPIPAWAKPAVGGLLLGMLVTPVLLLVGTRLGSGRGLGLLGGGYGLAQVAVGGASWFPGGWQGVELLVFLGFVKILAASLTVGTGGSAGDFGPAMVIGGIFGGAFGRAAQLLLDDPRIDPGAFALVGMGTFYGGLAHVPIAALVMTCELAGSYDLLVPLMLAEGIAFVVLRNRSLYHAQVATKRDSPAHRDDLIVDVLKGVRVDSILSLDRPYVSFTRKTPAREVIRQIAGSTWQDTFPVLGADGALAGVIDADVLRTLAGEEEAIGVSVADDMMKEPASVAASDDLGTALERMIALGVREIVVTHEDGRILGIVDQSEVTAVYLSVTRGKSTRPG